MIGLDGRLAPTTAPLTPARLRAVIRALRGAAPGLRALADDARIAALDRVATSWLDPTSPWRRRALAELPISTGLPASMLESALDGLWAALRAPALAATLRDERVGSALARPDLALHVLAGNVPGVGVFGLVAALLAGIPSLVKPAAREPFLPALVLESLRAEAPALAGAVAVTPWRGGATDLDAAAIADADVVLAYGRDETLDRVAALRPRRLLRFGHRLSVALIAGAATSPATAAALARQTALFDQQGCLSPQLACVEDAEPGAAERFAALVADALATLATTWPPAAPSLAETAATWRWLEHQRWRAQEGEPVSVHGGRDGTGGVVCDRSEHWPMSPTLRHLVLLPIPRLAAAAATLERVGGLVEAVGYAGPTDGLAEAAAVAAAIGAHRLCPLDRLQTPPFAWRQSGHARLASLLGEAPPETPAGYA